MSEFAKFLIVRTKEMVVLGIQCSDFFATINLESGAVLGPRARSDDAWIVLTFPPQAIAEQKYTTSGDIATEGASVVVYDARDATELVRILQPAPVGQFAFSANGALIATAGDYRIVRVWTSGSGPLDKEILP